MPGLIEYSKLVSKYSTENVLNAWEILKKEYPQFNKPTILDIIEMVEDTELESLKGILEKELGLE